MDVWHFLLRTLTSFDLWQATLQYAAILLLPALGAILSERSGVINIAMEGMMLVGAYSAVAITLVTNNLVLGVLGAIICAGLIALIHAIASIHFHANQIVSGIAINLAGLGLTSYLLFTQTSGQGIEPLHLRLPQLNWEPLSSIPFLGPVLFQQNLVFYLTILLLVGLHFFLFHTNIGLRIRAVGEHPHAADTAGVNVRLVRYLCVVASGMFSGLAGAFLTLGIAGTFNANMTAGDGFIALAAMVFGRYTPFGAAGACLLFGFGRALGFRLGGSAGIGVPEEFLNAIPYVLTLVVLIALVGRSNAPAADGQPYEPGTE